MEKCVKAFFVKGYYYVLVHGLFEPCQNFRSLGSIYVCAITGLCGVMNFEDSFSSDILLWRSFVKIIKKNSKNDKNCFKKKEIVKKFIIKFL